MTAALARLDLENHGSSRVRQRGGERDPRFADPWLGHDSIPKHRDGAQECEMEGFSLSFQTRIQYGAPAGLKVGQGYTVGTGSHKAEDRNPVKNTLVEIRGRA